MMEKLTHKNMQKSALKFLTLSASAMFLFACTMEPDYVVPETPLNSEAQKLENFKHSEGLWTDATPNDAELKGNWWQIFKDSNLESLINTCRENNPDLKSAFATFSVAKERARMDEADFFPHAGAHLSYARTGTSYNEFSSRGTFDDYRVGLGLTWDLDLFGRVQALVASDKAEAQAAFAAYQNLMLVLEAQVAKTYFSILQTNAEIELLKKTIESRKSQLRVQEVSYKSGTVSMLEVKRTEQLYYEALSQLSNVENARENAFNLLGYLTGNVSSRIADITVKLNDELPTVPKVIPSELLQRRPDIAAAERKVFAANYRIGSATSAFFPTIKITSSLDLASADIDSLIDSGSLAWGVSPSIYFPLFQAGKLIAQREIALAEHLRIVEEYKATVLKAIYEVEEALSAVKNLNTEYKAREKAASAARQVEQLARNQYKVGTINHFEYADAERLALTNDLAKISLKGAQYKSVVNLILALGGGFNQEAQRKDVEVEE